MQATLELAHPHLNRGSKAYSPFTASNVF